MVRRFQIRHCVFGKHYFAKNISSSAPAEHSYHSSVNGKKQRMKIRTTKKQGCDAILRIKELALFDDYRINLDSAVTSNAQRIMKDTVLVKLKTDRGNGEARMISRFYVEVPLENAHNHSLNSPAILMSNEITPISVIKFLVLLLKVTQRSELLKCY